MNDHRYAISRQPHVEFETVGAVFKCAHERCQSILRRECRRTAVTDD